MENWSVATKNDFIQMFCGGYLGGGMGRKVYVSRFDEGVVIKVATSQNGIIQNVIENEIWEQVRWDGYKDVRKWLAPCIEISGGCSVLLQKRTWPVKELPEKLPNWFTDIKPSNFGLYEDQIVCHDYGFLIHVINLAYDKLELIKVKREESGEDSE